MRTVVDQISGLAHMARCSHWDALIEAVATVTLHGCFGVVLRQDAAKVTILTDEVVHMLDSASMLDYVCGGVSPTCAFSLGSIKSCSARSFSPGSCSIQAQTRKGQSRHFTYLQVGKLTDLPIKLDERR